MGILSFVTGTSRPTYPAYPAQLQWWTSGINHTLLFTWVLTPLVEVNNSSSSPFEGGVSDAAGFAYQSVH